MTTVVALLIGFTLLLQYPRSPKNRIFFLMCVSAAGSATAVFFGPLHFYHLLSIFGRDRGAAKYLAFAGIFAAALLLVFEIFSGPLALPVRGLTLLFMGVSFIFLSQIFTGLRRNIHVAPYLGLLLFLMAAYMWAAFDFYLAALALVHYKLNFLDIRHRHSRLTLMALIYAGLLSILFSIGAALVGPASHLNLQPQTKVMIITGLSGVFFLTGTLLYGYAVYYQTSFKRGLLTEIIHRLDAPVTALTHLATRLSGLRQHDESVDETNTLISEIESKIAALENEVDTLLELACVYEDKVVLAKTQIDLAEKLRALVASVRPIAEKKGLALSEQISSTGIVDVDFQKFQFVANRLFANAIRFSDRGKITVRLIDAPHEILFEVQDCGIGIRPADLSVLFERRLSTDQFGEKTGRHLALAYGWVLAHDGKMWAESDGPGHGAKIVVAFPRR